MEANVSLGIFDMGEFNYLSPNSIKTKISFTGGKIVNYTFKKERYLATSPILNEFCRNISDKNGNYILNQEYY